jgi:hypothetical protein
MKHIKKIQKFVTSSEISENVVGKFNDFDSLNEKVEIESKEDILSKRAEITSKIEEIEAELESSTEEEKQEELELELESLKQDLSKYTLLAEKHVFTHKSIIKK